MSLIHHVDQVEADVVALQCHVCGAAHDPDEFDADLRCSSCGTGGLIPRRHTSIAKRFPPPLGRRYTPVPEALMDHAEALGLGPHEMLLVIALERFRRAMGDEVFPGRLTLARLTRLSEHQVKRASTKLVELGLIRRRQPGNADEKRRGRAPNRIDLDPLWHRLAAEDLRSTPAHQSSGFAGHQRPQSEPGGYLRAPTNGFAGADGSICGAPVHPEVEVEVDLFERDPVGTSAATPPLAIEDLDEPLDLADPGSYTDQWQQVREALRRRGAVNGSLDPPNREGTTHEDQLVECILETFPGSVEEPTNGRPA